MAGRWGGSYVVRETQNAIRKTQDAKRETPCSPLSKGGWGGYSFPGAGEG